ncbi:MAG TPA: DUF1259 domain-containing protein [Burkholderiales bacterium]|nr:DUF1259 domain-containing protein [Burkholderiales bacterium]
MRNWIVMGVLLAAMQFLSPGLLAAGLPPDYRQVLAYLDKKGDYKNHVFKVGIPRNDLQVNVDGVDTPTAFGFGGWLAMTKGKNGLDVMMGDLVLLQDEVNPVMSALLDNGLEVTALHNHFFWEEPRIFYMHVHGRGQAMELAKKVKPALDLIGNDAVGASQSEKSVDFAKGSLDAAALSRIIGHAGEQNGQVYKITLGRDDLKVDEMGARINSRMGLNTWAAFYGSDERAVIAGDVAVLENEVTPVLRALRAHELDVVAIHHHMTGSRPMVIFLHYWGQGQAVKLAEGFKSALDQLGLGTSRVH